MAFCAAITALAIVISIFKCTRGENYDAWTSYIYLALYAVLFLLLIWASARLLITLRTGFLSIYSKVRCRIISISAVCASTLLLRIAMSVVYSMFIEDFRRFKERSLQENTVSYPLMFASYSIFAELVPLLAFQLFLIMPINNRLPVEYQQSFTSIDSVGQHVDQPVTRRSTSETTINRSIVRNFGKTFD